MHTIQTKLNDKQRKIRSAFQMKRLFIQMNFGFVIFVLN